MEQSSTQTRHDLADPSVVRDLFEMAAQEVLFRLVSVSTGKMTHERAHDMDEALAKHLARALMGENPDFVPVAGWHGLPCAQSLEAVDRQLYASLWPEGKPEDLANPRVRMVRATTTFYRALYKSISAQMRRDDVTREAVLEAMREVTDRYALAALPVRESNA